MRMPTCLVLALLTMQPRLEAEESIVAANRIAMGGGKVKSDEARQIAREWQKTAYPHADPARPDPGALAVAGFAVRRVKVPKKQ